MLGNHLYRYGEQKYGADPRWTAHPHVIHSNDMEFHAAGTSGEHIHRHRVYSEDQVDAFVENRAGVRSKFEAGIPEALRLTTLAAAEKQLAFYKKETEKVISALGRYPELRVAFRKALRIHAQA